MPVTFDSQGVLRGLISAMQYTWTPLLDTRMPPLESDRLHDYYWPVGVTEQELLCVVCKVNLTLRLKMCLFLFIFTGRLT